MQAFLYLAAVASGVLNAVQSGQNVTLSKSLSQPLLATFTVALVNSAVYAAAIPFVGIGWPGWARVAETPWWAWLGGTSGGLYVLAVVFVAEKTGAAVFTGLAVTAAIITSITLDHFGLVGFRVHPATLWRLAGGALMIAGLGLVCAF